MSGNAGKRCRCGSDAVTAHVSLTSAAVMRTSAALASTERLKSLEVSVYGARWGSFSAYPDCPMKAACKRARDTIAVDQLSFLFAEDGVLAPNDRAAKSAPKPPSVSTPAAVESGCLSAPAWPIEAARVRSKRKPVARRSPSEFGQGERQLTVDEAAEILAVSVKTLEAWRRLGKGPSFVKLGRAVRYTQHALDQFTSARTVRNSAEGRMLDMQR